MQNNGTKLPDVPDSISLNAKKMENGEVRVRIAHDASGLSAGITSNAEHHGAFGWQNSHRHLSDMQEIYALQTGCLVVATLSDASDKPVLKRYEAGSVFILSGGHAHNVFVFEGSVFAVVKLGSSEGRKDWEPAPELDALLEQVDRTAFDILDPE